ncbi:hypothetical protein DFH27DRAFT_35009 [Peziza echinospora]|nr:hypothetical protein DFH27DRAFT_35009 [Peziza echinospora]
MRNMAMNPTSRIRDTTLNGQSVRLGWRRWTWGTGVLLISMIMMMVRVVDARPAKPLYVFDSDASFNITTKRGFAAPKCSRLCYPFDETVFESKKVPCAEFEGDPAKWVPCLCTDRPFLRFLSACIFHKCGPAIPSAFEFGYNICSDYNISLPSPPGNPSHPVHLFRRCRVLTLDPEAIKQLNITLPNDAISLPNTLGNLTFSNELPAPQNGASDSNENPGLVYEGYFVKAIASQIVRSRGLVVSAFVVILGWATLF